MSTPLERMWRQPPLCWRTLPCTVCSQRTSDSCAVTARCPGAGGIWIRTGHIPLNVFISRQQNSAPLYIWSSKQIRVKAGQESPSSPQPHSGCSLCFVSPAQAGTGICLSQGRRKYRGWVINMHQCLKAGDQGQFYEKIILEFKKSGGEGVWECVKPHNGKGTILSFILDRRRGTH